MPESDNDSGGAHNNAGNNESPSTREQDRFLPIANVSRIMKKALPTNAKISKDAKETVQECVSEFISFVTGEASDKCQKEKRKTINGDDLLWSMATLGFDEYVEPLKVYLQRYREIEGDKGGGLTPKDGGGGSGGGATGGPNTGIVVGGGGFERGGGGVNIVSNAGGYQGGGSVGGGGGMYGAGDGGMMMMGGQQMYGRSA